MGVSKAGEDALALAECIAADGATARALQRYDALRRPAGLAVVARARWLGAYLQGQAQATDSDPARRALRSCNRPPSSRATFNKHFQ